MIGPPRNLGAGGKESMRRYILSAVAMMAVLPSVCATGFAAPLTLPVISGKEVVATVNGESITRDALERQLASMHEGVQEKKTRILKDPSELLTRMVNATLILQEARRMGLDQAPDVTAASDAFAGTTLRQLLYSYHVRNIKTPDGKEVERLYRAAIKEMRVTSVLLDKEEDARELESRLKTGGDFDALTARLVADGKAVGGQHGVYLRERDLLPEVAAALSGMKTGSISPVLKIGKGFSLFRVEDVRYPDDPEVLRNVREEALKKRKTEALKAYAEALKKKYVKVNSKRLAAVDYDSPEAGFEKLLKDKRVLATVKGDAPVTVSDLTDALMKKFFHGADEAGRQRKVNRRKEEVLDELVTKKAFAVEARRLKIDRSDLYRGMLDDNRKGLLFGFFVAKAIEPDIKVQEAEIKEYREAHNKEYTAPETMGYQALVFGRLDDAVDAVSKLRKGTEFQWVRQNAAGQLDPATVKGVLDLDGNIVLSGEEGGVQKAVAGASPGDYRLYASPEGPAYVLFIKEVTPSRPLPYESVREGIARKLFEEKRQKSLDEYIRSLRAASEIRLYATGKDLEGLVGLPEH